MGKITMTQAENLARQANINGVAEFIMQSGNDHDYETVERICETLMESYLRQIGGMEIDRRIFANIKKIANLPSRQRLRQLRQSYQTQ